MKKCLLSIMLALSLLGYSKNKRDVVILKNVPPTTVLIPKGSMWKYLDNGTDQGTTWKETTFDNSMWTSDIAPLGYGDPTKTIISFGPNETNKYVTSYFSKDITITDLNTLSDELEIGIRRDDGFVLYINGVEVIRNNMPTGPITSTTFASATIDGVDEKLYQTFFLPKSLFTNGNNRISVEMHQRDASSSDLGFDLYLKEKDPEYIAEPGHIATFTSVTPTVQTPILILPTEQRFQMLLKEGTPYSNGTSGLMPGSHDYTAYVPSQGTNASKSGYLFLNHENNPGGVSIANVDLSNDPQNLLWQQSNIRKVDFSSTSLVKTVRNCSGGLTPWGTVITAEETFELNDVNVDGYQDSGWFVEIDPVTASVKDYDNDGNKDKLFAMGRMSHENIVITNDGSIAYYGEDGGTNCVYKFVPTVANNLTAGNVYVLKLDTPLSDSEPTSDKGTWVQVPNTTQADRNNMRTNAGAVGGTNFNGVEDCEIGPDGMIYFTAKNTGRVYRFKDNGTTVSNIETFVGGLTYPIQTPTGVVNEPWSTGNDNLTFDDKGNLWVLQDGDRDYIWVVRPNHKQTNPQVLIHSSSPLGSEPTGLTFTPDFKYGFYSIQGPDTTTANQLDATGNNVKFDLSATLVFSHKSLLGQEVLSNELISNNKKIKIYPNPTNGLVTIDLNELVDSKIEVNVYDLLGKKIIQKSSDTSFIKTLEIDLSNYSNSNIYFFEITNGDQKETFRVIKTN